MDNYPIIHLEGSETWEQGYNLGKSLSELYPNEETWDFGYAVQYHEHPDVSSGIKNLKCLQVGWNDGDNWIWDVELGNGEKYRVEGWCDYTGWDCRSGSTWELQ